MGAAARAPAGAETEGLWPHLSGLFAAARAVGRAAATAVRITAFEEDGPARERVDATGPASGRGDLLGWDVADWYLIGGLTNCGYAPGEAASLAPAWAPVLNKWHLFDNPGDAEAFAAVTEKRVPAHAPFFACGIYQLR